MIGDTKTLTSGGTALTSLREGRRHAAACFRRLGASAMVVKYPDLLVRWAAGDSSNIRPAAVLPVGGVRVSNYCNLS